MKAMLVVFVFREREYAEQTCSSQGLNFPVCRNCAWPGGRVRDPDWGLCYFQDRQAGCLSGSHAPPSLELATHCRMKFMPSTPSYTFGYRVFLGSTF